ncbi:hypothetical protein [Mycobacterium sp. 852002-51961_SCH5331710]|uniref:hypothetical protein n=1 Tax=Mycobacterium sp. 852002-51961_SCH5331710 TaxID=1834105 RepID=UPI0007FF3CFF|nr:hypothetical protein [Mycobacterium sp. 852002-51961_SCH5331710]OBB44947.1 hypothetical protein A5752_03080 [Mycobacterium sp. 852002-51961_SCH5331710]
MTPRKTTARKAADTAQPERTTDTVTVTVRRPHAVYWDGAQRSGTLHGVDRLTAEDWQRQGWADIT